MEKLRLEINHHGDKRYYKWDTDELHNPYGPSVEYKNGSKYWYVNGKLHRENGPAIEFASGRKDWYVNGKLHRENSPAIEFANGHKEWYVNGKLHREDGPAPADSITSWNIREDDGSNPSRPVMHKLHKLLISLWFLMLVLICVGDHVYEYHECKSIEQRSKFSVINGCEVNVGGTWVPRQAWGGDKNE